jgi:cell wall-associated NlpC family hydrolase
VEPCIGLLFREHGRDGADCWGLVRLVLAEQFDINLPANVAGYAWTEDAPDIAVMGPFQRVCRAKGRLILPGNKPTWRQTRLINLPISCHFLFLN